MEETSRARQSLEAIIESSKQVEQQINLIATAATEQTSASGEISESAGQISSLSNETAQGAEEAVEALKNLASLASDLDGIIRQFRLKETGKPEEQSPPDTHGLYASAPMQPAPWLASRTGHTIARRETPDPATPAAGSLPSPGPRLSTSSHHARDLPSGMRRLLR